MYLLRDGTEVTIDQIRARPADPWAAVAIWPTAALCPDAGEWLGDLERCIAWAWLERVA